MQLCLIFKYFQKEKKSQMSNFISAKKNVLLSWNKSVEGLFYKVIGNFFILDQWKLHVECVWD